MIVNFVIFCDLVLCYKKIGVDLLTNLAFVFYVSASYVSVAYLRQAIVLNDYGRCTRSTSYYVLKFH